jgi:hypothetical protein
MHKIFWLENLKGRDHLEDNIRMDLGKIEWEGVGCDVSGSDYGQMTGPYEIGNEPWSSINFMST